MVLKVLVMGCVDRLHGAVSEERGIGRCQDFRLERLGGWSFIS